MDLLPVASSSLSYSSSTGLPVIEEPAHAHGHEKMATTGKFYIVVDGSNKKNKKRGKERKDCNI
jgi:hypothetical protein